jgi:hypothetical protein
VSAGVERLGAEAVELLGLVSTFSGFVIKSVAGFWLSDIGLEEIDVIFPESEFNESDPDS